MKYSIIFIFFFQINYISLTINQIIDISDKKLNYYYSLLNNESEWLWSQQLQNDAFSFYNHENGEVSVNPYFSEITAIALINHNNSEIFKEK